MRTMHRWCGRHCYEVDREIVVIDIDVPRTAIRTARHARLRSAARCRQIPAFNWPGVSDEWQSLCLLYTSGTTGDPKGVVYSHRGAYLSALGNGFSFGLTFDSIYLWTLPMFHCCGWSYPWAVVAAGGTQICLRKVEPAQIFRLIAEQRVTHLCGAPIVLNMLAHAPAEQRVPFDHKVTIATGGAAPPSSVFRSMEAIGFRVTHLYGATETYGPATSCVFQPEWNALPDDERFARMARQGVAYPMVEAVMVADPKTMVPVPRDGTTVGEIMVRSNTVMKGYLKNEAATAKTLVGDWCLSGDLAVWHPDGAIEIKDRSKDIIISGGENISSLEVEEVLTQHPAIMLAAVVARPDPKWGETPCAFLELKPGASQPDDKEIIAFCRARWRASRCQRNSSMARCPRPRPERSRNSCCGIRQAHCERRTRNRFCDGTPDAHAPCRRQRHPARLRHKRFRPAARSHHGLSPELACLAARLCCHAGRAVHRDRHRQPRHRRKRQADDRL